MIVFDVASHREALVGALIRSDAAQSMKLFKTLERVATIFEQKKTDTPKHGFLAFSD